MFFVCGVCCFVLVWFFSCEILCKYMVLIPKGNRLKTCLGIRNRSVCCHSNFALVTIQNSALPLKNRADAYPKRWEKNAVTFCLATKQYLISENQILQVLLFFWHADFSVWLVYWMGWRAAGQTECTAVGWWLVLPCWAIWPAGFPLVLQGRSTSGDFRHSLRMGEGFSSSNPPCSLMHVSLMITHSQS